MPVLWRLCHQHGFEEAAVGVLAFVVSQVVGKVAETSILARLYWLG